MVIIFSSLNASRASVDDCIATICFFNQERVDRRSNANVRREQVSDDQQEDECIVRVRVSGE